MILEDLAVESVGEEWMGDKGKWSPRRNLALWTFSEIDGRMDHSQGELGFTNTSSDLVETARISSNQGGCFGIGF